MLTLASTNRFALRRRAAVLAGASALLLGAPAAAPAFTAEWTSLPGLTAATGADWMRTFARGPDGATLYAATEGNGAFVSVNGGASWRSLSGGLVSAEARTVRALVADGARMLAGTQQGVFALNGTTWTPLGQGGGAGTLDASVQALLPVDGALLAGTFAGGVFRSTDGGQTWQPPGPGAGMPAGETVWSLASFGTLVLAGTTSGVYRSADGGVTWALASDGIPPSATTFRVFGDPFLPNVWYAGTTDGVYRSLDAGLTWASISDGLPAGGNGAVRDLKTVFSATGARLYAATGRGVHAATVRLGRTPGDVAWSPVTTAGMAPNLEVWALTDLFGPGTGSLVAGTRSNGGYGLTFLAPYNLSAPSLQGIAKVGRTLTALPGRWGGTGAFSYAFAWERCSLPSALCTRLDEDDDTHVLTDDDRGSYIRVTVTASNGAPSFAWPSEESGSVHVGAAEGTMPGDNQVSPPSVTIDAPGQLSLPRVGDVARVTVRNSQPNQTFNPNATSVAYQWLRCEEANAGCEEIPGAISPAYALRTEDAGLRVKARLTGTNASGARVIESATATNPVVPDPAANVAAPTLLGRAVVGQSLVGGVGAWKSPRTTYERQWEACDADGASCAPIAGETSAAYTVRAADAGRRLRMRVRADVNEAARLPLAVDAHTPLSDVVAPAGAGGPGEEAGRVDDSGSLGNGPAAPRPQPPVVDRVKPALSRLSLSRARFAAGARGVKLRFRLSEAATLRLTVLGPARRRGARPKVAGRITVGGRRAGAGAVAFSGRIGRRALRPGAYRLLVTPVDAAGNRGARRVVAFRVARR